MATSYNIGNSSDIGITANTTTTILQADAAATKRIKLADFSISCKSIDPNAQTGQVWVMRKGSADKGTGVTTAITKPRDPAEPTALFTARETFSAEGTVANWHVMAGPFPLSPVSTLFAWQFAPGDEPTCNVNEALAVVARFPGAQSAQASMTVRE